MPFRQTSGHLKKVHPRPFLEFPKASDETSGISWWERILTTDGLSVSCFQENSNSGEERLSKMFSQRSWTPWPIRLEITTAIMMDMHPQTRCPVPHPWQNSELGLWPGECPCCKAVLQLLMDVGLVGRRGCKSFSSLEMEGPTLN